MTPEMLRTGAVIITGETARKENANEVLGGSWSDLAGDPSWPPPDRIWSRYSPPGGRTDALSKRKAHGHRQCGHRRRTSNIAVYEKGVLRGPAASTSAGGSSRWKTAASATFSQDPGPWPPPTESRWRWATGPIPSSLAARVPPHGGPNRPRPSAWRGRTATTPAFIPTTAKASAGAADHRRGDLPGGVADCIYQEMEGDVFRFGDIGVLLGKAIRADPDLSRVERFTSIETIRATVVGAGTHTTEVSGSTIHYEQGTLPLKNVPILKVSEEDEASLETLKASILNQMPLYMPEGKAEQLAIAFTGEKRTSFADIQALAAAIIESTKEVISSRYPLVVVVENDIGKVLGNALNVLLKREKDVICIDGIRTLSGDYIDIGEPYCRRAGAARSDQDLDFQFLNVRTYER